jgi:hypothetical protein
MRSKTILSIAAFTIAFVLSTAFASLFITKIAYQSESVIMPSYTTKNTSCFKNRGKNYVADKIETFVKQDVSNGRERDRRLYQIDEDFRSSFSSSSFHEYSEVVSEYVSNSENLSVENTPADFQKAWRKHLKAWRDYANFLDKMEHSSAQTEMSEFEVSELENTYSSDINNTWYEVLRIGRNHGAEVY